MTDDIKRVSYLTCFLLNGSSTTVPNPPRHDFTAIVPRMHMGASTEEFSVVTVKASGEVVWSSPDSQDKPGCPMTSTPLYWVSESHSAGAMEIEEGQSIFAGRIKVSKTRPFPDGKSPSFVLLIGQLTVPADSGAALAALLPEGYRPSSPVHVIVNLEGDVVSITPDGTISVQSQPGRTLLMDNVRFVSGPATPDIPAVIRARFAQRTSLTCIARSDTVVAKNTSFPLSAVGSDLFFSVTVTAASTAPQWEQSVVVLTRTGRLVHLGQSSSTKITPQLTCEIIVPSTLVSPTNDKVLPPPEMLIPSPSQEEEWTEFKQAVGQKISAIVFAQLTGEDEAKCMRRDRLWRQTNHKAP